MKRMRLKIWVWFLVCFFGFGVKIAWAEWYPGIIHAHSTFSDGARSPKVLVNRAKGVGQFVREAERPRFLVVTDHYEQIDNFDNYRNGFSKLASSDFVIITGAEISTYWNGAASHLLTLGDIRFDDDLMRLQGQKDTQQAIIDRVNELGLLPVAAHPSLTALRYEQWRGDFKNYQFDPAVKTGPKGIEFFNDEPEGYSRTRDLWYLTRLRRGDIIFVTSGCDSHWPADVYDDDRWTRKTWVYCKELNQKSLLEAMAQGHTYAAQHGASLENLNYIPGFQAQDVKDGKCPKFLFFVAFDKEISDSKTIQIYRDGKLIESSVRTHKKENIKGLQKIAYDWEDKGVKEGEHQYVIEVIDGTGTEAGGILITSPINLRVKKFSPPPVPQSSILGIYVSPGKDPKKRRFIDIRKDNSCFIGNYFRWKIEIREGRFTDLLVFPEGASPEESKPLDGGPIGKNLIALTGMRMFIKEKGASPIKSSQGKIWSSYESKLGQGPSLQFREDGICFIGFKAKWVVKDDTLRVYRKLRKLGEFKIKNNTLEAPDGEVFLKKD